MIFIFIAFRAHSKIILFCRTVTNIELQDLDEEGILNTTGRENEASNSDGEDVITENIAGGGGAIAHDQEEVLLTRKVKKEKLYAKRFTYT